MINIRDNDHERGNYDDAVSHSVVPVYLVEIRNDRYSKVARRCHADKR
ncbi:hypothetical protein [Bradyrhizobium jicamae]|nr:hypothetical protein [Bradyrhizobium jicamae]